MREITNELKQEILRKILERDKNAPRRNNELFYHPEKVYSFGIVNNEIVQWEESTVYEPYEYDRVFYDAGEVVNIDGGKREQVLILNMSVQWPPTKLYLYFQS